MSYNIHLNLQDTRNSRCNAPFIDDQALFFYARLPENFFSLLGIDRHSNPANYTITSRQLVTNSLDPSNVKWSQGTEDVLTCESPDISTTTVTEVTTIITTTGEPTERVFSSTTLPEIKKMIGGMTEITDVVQSTVLEMTTTITTTEVFLTAVLKGIRLAVVDSRSRGLSSQLQTQIMVCIP